MPTFKLYIKALVKCTCVRACLPGLPQFCLIPGKRTVLLFFLLCWINNIIAAQLLGFNFWEVQFDVQATVGSQALMPSVILSRCFEGSASQREASLPVWMERTSAADATAAAGIHSSGLNPTLCAASLWHIGAKWKHQQVRVRNAEWIKWNLSQWHEKHFLKKTFLLFLWHDHTLALFPADLIQN